MFQRLKLKKQIRQSKSKIEALEQKRIRSQAALVSAILEHRDPDDEDVEYFNNFTRLIEDERKVLQALMEKSEGSIRQCRKNI